MPYVDLSEFLSENELVLQGLGPRDYSVPAPDAETGLKYSALTTVAVRASKGETLTTTELQALKLDDGEERQFVVQILGQAVVDQMVEDGLPWPAVVRSAQYAFAHFAVSPEAAQKALAGGAFSGKAPAPANRATRRGTPQDRQVSTASKRPRKTQA